MVMRPVAKALYLLEKTGNIKAFLLLCDGLKVAIIRSLTKVDLMYQGQSHLCMLPSVSLMLAYTAIFSQEES